MSRPALEVADIFRDHGAAWRRANAGHISLDQLKVMSAIERCRTAALGGHVARCEDCAHTVIAYNSCRNRHCPKCQGAAAKQWLAERETELLPVPYFHVVFTLPAPVADLAYQNKAVIYDLLFKAAADTTLTIAADPRHLGAQIGATLVLHTWGSALTHHPHVHGIVPGGGLSLDGERWIACRPGFFLPVRVLSRLFRRRFLEALADAHRLGQLQFFGEYAALADPAVFAQWLAPLRACEWFVYAKRPFAGPEAVTNLNELEFIRGEIWANIWHSNRIAKIDPKSGQVTAWIDLAAIAEPETREQEDVLNGIAWDPAKQRIFVTGKNWSKLFEIVVK